MKKKFIYAISLLLFLCFVLSGCIKADRPQDEKISEKNNGFDLKLNITPYSPKTMTIGGVDYLVSRTPAGKFGGTLVTSTIGEGPKTFNSWNSMDATSSQAADIMFDALVTTDAYTGEVIPKLAKSIKILPDNKTYIVELRHGLKWSDGKEITADDVYFTWNTIIFGGFGNTSTRDAMYIGSQLPKIEKIDKYTVKFTTPKPFSPFLRQLSVPIAPKHVLEPVTKQGKRAFASFWSSNTNPSEFVTSGAFKLKEYVPAQRLVYVRNPNYYMIDEKAQKLPYLDKYIILIVGDLNNELLKFKAGELDTVGLRGSNVALFKEKEKFSDYKIYNLGPNTGTIYFAFNLNTRKNEKGNYYVNPVKQKWFNDLNFRKAVDYALDRENMVFNISAGVAQPLFTPEPLSSIYLNEKIAKGHPRDIKKAKEYLEKSGFYLKKGKLYDKNGNEALELPNAEGEKTRLYESEDGTIYYTVTPAATAETPAPATTLYSYNAAEGEKTIGTYAEIDKISVSSGWLLTDADGKQSLYLNYEGVFVFKDLENVVAVQTNGSKGGYRFEKDTVVTSGYDIFRVEIGGTDGESTYRYFMLQTNVTMPAAMIF